MRSLLNSSPSEVRLLMRGGDRGTPTRHAPQRLVCDLPFTLEGTVVEQRARQVFAELAERGIEADLGCGCPPTRSGAWRCSRVADTVLAGLRNAASSRNSSSLLALTAQLGGEACNASLLNAAARLCERASLCPGPQGLDSRRAA